jgi:hypothetical protein
MIALCLVLGSNLGGCSSDANGSRATEAGNVDEEHVDDVTKAELLVDGQPVKDVSEAAALLTFELIVPDGLTPLRVEVTNPESGTPPKDRSVAMTFETSRLGRFAVIERASTLTDDGLAAIAENCTVESGCNAKEYVETLPDGTLALILESPGAGAIWVWDGVYVDVFNTEGFTADAAREVESLMAVAAGRA